VIAVMAIVAGSERSTAQGPEAKPRRFVEPQLDRCTIVGENHVLKPIRVISPRSDEHVAGNLRLTIDKSRIAAVHTSDNREAWASQIPRWDHLEVPEPGDGQDRAVRGSCELY
jgi:hypothetical protein